MNIAEALKLFELPTVDEFDDLISHLDTHHFCKNMHLREARQKNKKRVLRFLHMVKKLGQDKVTGLLNGPENLELEYELYKKNGKINFFITAYDGDPVVLKRTLKKLKKRLFDRVEMEKDDGENYANYTEGEFYLRRRVDGMPITHPNIQNALSLRVIKKNFASKIGDWGFELLNP